MTTTVIWCYQKGKKWVLDSTYLDLIWVGSSLEDCQLKKRMFLMAGASHQQSFFTPLDSSNDFMKPNLEEFWKLETIGIQEPVNDSDDEQAIQKFNDTARKTNGRYEVTWPWKEENPQLPDNYQLTLEIRTFSWLGSVA